MSKDRPEPSPITATAQQPVASSRAEIEAFLGQVKALDPSIAASERGRLIFALDATMSRQPTWDQACHTPGRNVPRSGCRWRSRSSPSLRKEVADHPGDISRPA